jgi:hypothetical protein
MHYILDCAPLARLTGTPHSKILTNGNSSIKESQRDPRSSGGDLLENTVDSLQLLHVCRPPDAQKPECDKDMLFALAVTSCGLDLGMEQPRGDSHWSNKRWYNNILLEQG